MSSSNLYVNATVGFAQTRWSRLVSPTVSLAVFISLLVHLALIYLAWNYAVPIGSGERVVESRSETLSARVEEVPMLEFSASLSKEADDASVPASDEGRDTDEMDEIDEPTSRQAQVRTEDPPTEDAEPTPAQLDEPVEADESTEVAAATVEPTIEPISEQVTEPSVEPVPRDVSVPSASEPATLPSSAASNAESSGNTNSEDVAGATNSEQREVGERGGGSSGAGDGARRGAAGTGEGSSAPTLRAISNTEVPYPRDAWANGWETTCSARLYIDTDGRVKRVEEIRCGSYSPVFAPALRNHILRWFRFEPARRNGVVSRAVIRWEHDFRIR